MTHLQGVAQINDAKEKKKKGVALLIKMPKCSELETVRRNKANKILGHY